MGLVMLFRQAQTKVFCGFLFVVSLAGGRGGELIVADFDTQSAFNRFSGDSGGFANGEASIESGFDTEVFHGSSGASLRLRYSVEAGFCGIWNSLLGKITFPRHTLNFTDLHAPLRDSSGNPARVEGVQVNGISFWARGDGKGEFAHQLKLELKSAHGSPGSAVFAVTNDAVWRRYDLPLDLLGAADFSAIKEMVFIIEDWRNNNRAGGTLYLDDVSLRTDEPAVHPDRWNDDALLDIVSHRAFSYFLRFTDELGFALDRSTFSDMVSVGTIGFQLTAYCIGHQRQWADPEHLEQRVAGILRQLSRLPMGPEAGTSRAGYRGFYYHFLGANTGTRKDVNVELSIYDTMLLMYGVLSCREYFPQNSEIQQLSRNLFDRVEWDWFVDRRPGINQNQFHLEWHPGPNRAGTFRGHVDGQTDEAFMVDVLALGSQTYPVSTDTIFARTRFFGSYPAPDGPSILVSWRGSLFNYFFASCWLNFEARGLDLHATKPVDIWRNNKLAIEANRRFCIEHATPTPGQANGRYATYGENAWGLTACDNLVARGADFPSEYFSFGALPTEENLRFRTRALHAGTIAVYGAASSINYTPGESIAALRHYFQVQKLWSPLFGFGDAFSLDPHYLEGPYDREGNPTIRPAAFLNGPWINSMTMGVNVGPMLLAIENHRSGLVWELTRRNPEITIGMDRIFGITTVAPELVTIAHHSPTVVTIRWEPEPEASEYAVYASRDLSDWRLLQGGIKGTQWTDAGDRGGSQRFYLIKAIR